MTFTQKTLTINKQKVQLNIWDTVGQEKFRSLSKLFFKDTKIVALVYSITNRKSFDDLGFWLNIFKETIGVDVVIGVMGNKSDLFLEQVVNEEEGEKFAQEHGGFFDLVSAKDNKPGLDKFITKLVTECLKKNKNLSPSNGIKLVNQEQTQEIKAGCCAGDKDKRIIRNYSEIIKEKKGKIYSVFLGDISAGKTSIINRIQKSDFNLSETHTDELMKFNYTYNKGKMKLDIEINDVDINKKKSTEFIDIIKQSNIFFIVYDVKSQKSLENIHFWIEVIQKIKKNINKELIYILANKNDREDGNKNAQLIREGRDIAQENKIMFKAISAKDNEGINGIMKESVESYLALP
jgi:GTPase SAR1 family protein